MTRNVNPRRALVTAYLDQYETKERVSTAELATGLIGWLHTLAEQGDSDAPVALEEIRRDGAQAWVKRARSQRHYWADADTGRVLGMRSHAGVIARDDKGASTGHFQQVAFRSLTRAELTEWRDRYAAQRDTASIQVATADQVLRAWDDHPEAETAGDVCALAGIGIPDELTGT